VALHSFAGKTVRGRSVGLVRGGGGKIVTDLIVWQRRTWGSHPGHLAALAWAGSGLTKYGFLYRDCIGKQPLSAGRTRGSVWTLTRRLLDVHREMPGGWRRLRGSSLAVPGWKPSHGTA